MRLKVYGADIEFANHTWFATLYPWFIWGLASLFILYEYILQISPSVMVPELMRSFHVNGAWLGNLAACYYYAYFLMQIPVGLIIDRYTPRNVISCAVAICATGAWVFGATDSVNVALFGRFLIGLGASFAIVGTMKLISIWFPPRRFALMAGLMLTVGMLGASAGQEPFAILLNHYSWRNILFMTGVLGYVLAMIIWVFIFSPVRDVAMDKRHSTDHHWLTGLKNIIKNPQCWVTAIYSGLAFAPITSFAGLWGVPFLSEKYIHMPHIDTTALISLVFIGLAVSAPVSGWLSDRMNRRKPVMYAGTLMGMACLSALVYLPVLPEYLLAMLLFGFGFFIGFFFVSFAIMKEINMPAYTGISMGFTNMFNALFGAATEPLIGRLLDLHWRGHSNTGAPIYTLANYQHAFVVLLSILGIAFVLLLLVKETYCKPLGE
jgi:MFS family permease